MTTPEFAADRYRGPLEDYEQCQSSQTFDTTCFPSEAEIADLHKTWAGRNDCVGGRNPDNPGRLYC